MAAAPDTCRKDSGPLPGVVRERLVGLGHLVDVVALLDYVAVALDGVGSARAKTSPSADLLRGELFAIQKKASKARSSDPATVAHWRSIAAQIAKALEKN